MGIRSISMSSRLALHPQRKRKFFAGLAQLLDEDPPPVRPLPGAFFGPELPEEWAPPSSSPTLSDSCESIEFGVPRAPSSGINSQQSSYNESMADSLLFLPTNSLNSTTNSQKRQQHVHFDFALETKRDVSAAGSNSSKHTPLPPTTLVNSELISEKTLVTVRLELVDYYDVDRMCELSPCWLQSDGASCEIHQAPIRRPMLLFCIQALDEFIARNEWQGQQRWRVQACKVARRVFTAMWEEDVLGMAASERDIVVTDYVAKKTKIAGVAIDVWRIISRYWDTYKQNYLHQQELYFTDAPHDGSMHAASKWDQVRALLHVYGMKPSQALRLVEQLGGEQLNVCKLTDKQLQAIACGVSSIEHLHVGMNYLTGKAASSTRRKEDSATRPMISQQDGKTAFKAIQIHLTNWNDGVQVFPCGSFSRGAAFISVLDVLVALPTFEDDPECSEAKADNKTFDEVVAALTTANVIQQGVMRRLSRNRGVCIVPFKNNSILLDLKVYTPPRSWLALLYFTGPEDFVLTFFAELLKRSLREIPDTSFECIYASVAEVLGQEKLLEITSEKDLFDIVDRAFVQPTDRI